MSVLFSLPSRPVSSYPIMFLSILSCHISLLPFLLVPSLIIIRICKIPLQSHPVPLYFFSSCPVFSASFVLSAMSSLILSFYIPFRFVMSRPIYFHPVPSSPVSFRSFSSHTILHVHLVPSSPIISHYVILYLIISHHVPLVSSRLVPKYN